MGFMKRAGLYCLRQRWKTVLLFLVMTLIGTSLLTGLGIRDGAEGGAADVRTAVSGKIELTIDTEGHMGGGEQNEWGTAYCYNGDLISQEMVEAIRRVEGVVDYNVEETGGFYGAGVDFKYLPSALELSYTPYGQASSYTAALSSEKCKAFQNGKYRLVAGRHITPEDSYVCLISKELADYNKRSVGDTIHMYSLDADAEAAFEIVGIFDGTEGTAGNALTVDEIPANCGYVAYGAVQDLFKDIDEEGYLQLTIYVEDPVGIQNVYDNISALPELKGKTLKLTMDTEEYDAVSAPLESLKKSVDTTLVIISVVSVVILTLLFTIWIRGRKKEIGILLSLGKSKTDILLQIFTEAFAVTAVSFAASIPCSFLTAEKVGAFFASRASVRTVGLPVQIHAACLFPLSLIGILLIGISVTASSWTIVRLQPKEILTKMS